MITENRAAKDIISGNTIIYGGVTHKVVSTSKTLGMMEEEDDGVRFSILRFPGGDPFSFVIHGNSNLKVVTEW